MRQYDYPTPNLGAKGYMKGRILRGWADCVWELVLWVLVSGYDATGWIKKV